MKNYLFSYVLASLTVAYLAVVSANVAMAEEGLVDAEQRLSDAVKALIERVNALEALPDRINALEEQPDWPAGSYCIVAHNKTCPQGFVHQEGFLRALSVYPQGSASDYIRESSDKSAGIFIQCHGSCRQFGEWSGEIHVSTCCKSQ